MEARKDNKLIPWGDTVLDAYLDGELDAAQRDAVERQLRDDAEAAEYVRCGRRIRHDLHRLFDARLQSPLPPAQVELGLEIERLIDRVPPVQARPRDNWLRLPVQLAAAAVLTVVILSALALGLHALVGGPSEQDLFALFSPGQTTDSADDGQSALDDEGLAPEATLAVGEATIAGVDDGADIMPDVDIGAPDFGPFGFDLVSARLLASRDDNSMQLVYESAAGTRVELFYSPDAESQETSLTVMEEGPVSALFWRAAGRSYSLIGDVDREVILEMGRAVNGEWTTPLPNQTTGSSGLGSGLDDNVDDVPNAPAATSDDAGVVGDESL